MRAYHYLCSEYALEAISNQRLKAAEYSSLNDPFELNAADLGDAELRRGIRDFARDWAAHNGLCSFSRTWRQPLMWSHYADRHRGAVLEFEICDDNAIAVKYSSKKVGVDLEKIKARGFRAPEAYKLIMTKYSGWSYEREIRIIFPLSECVTDRGMYFYPFDESVQVKRIIIGPQSSLEVADIKAAKHFAQKLRVAKARLGFRRFEIVKDGRFEEVLL